MRLPSRRCRAAVPAVLLASIVFSFAARTHAALPSWKDVLGRGGPRRHVWTARGGPVFDLPAILAPPLEARVLKSSVHQGIVTEEIRFLSEVDNGVPVEIFAYFSYPKQRRALPAFIWIEGGLAPARTMRTVFGARRGYATLAIDFPRPGLRSTGRYPINLGLQLDENPRQAPIYHGAVALLRSVSFLASRPEVDGNRIGMAGSSWGGLFTTLMTGLDPRLKVGACMFGTGNLQMGNMWWDAYDRSARYPPFVREHWRTTLDGAARLRRRAVPIAWFTGTNDWFFWMPSVDKTFEEAAGPRHLALVPNWDHALTPALVEQTFTWLDIHLKGAPPMLEVSPLRLERRATATGPRWLARWTYGGDQAVPAVQGSALPQGAHPRLAKPRRFREARLIWSYGESGNWYAREWQSMPATRRGRECFAWLPASRLPIICSGTVVDATSFRSSTTLRRAAPLPPGAAEKFSYDGCAPWGSFEARQWDYLKRHHHWLPLVRAGVAGPMRDGQYAARVPEGETRLPLLHFTDGLRHRLRLSLRSTGRVPVTVEVETARRFNNSLRPMRARLLARPRWTDYVLEWTPRESLLARWNVRLIVPPGQQVLLDSVRFEPVPDAPFLEQPLNGAGADKPGPRRKPYAVVRAPLATVTRYRLAARPEIDDRIFWQP